VEVGVQTTQPFQFSPCVALGRFHRSITRPFFSKDRVSDFDVFDHHADQVIAKLKVRFEEGIAVDIQDVLSRFTLDTATEFLFGQDVNTLAADLPYPSTYRGPNRGREHPSDRFALAFGRAMQYTFPRVIYEEFWPLTDFWEDTVATQREITHEFIDPIVHAALEKRNAASEEIDEIWEEVTLLDYLVQQTDGGNELTQQPNFELNLVHRFRYYQRRSLQYHVGGPGYGENHSSQLFGVHLTLERNQTAALTTFTVTMLAENPHVFTRLRDEVINILGPQGKVNAENLRAMNYLRAVLNGEWIAGLLRLKRTTLTMTPETLRLYPSV
jgi:cytochrome P450